MPMIKEIIKYAASDRELKMLLDKAYDYAQVYVLAKQRQKGCDGMGEVTNLKDEFQTVLGELFEYCKNKNYISADLLLLDALDIDSLSIEMFRECTS